MRPIFTGLLLLISVFYVYGSITIHCPPDQWLSCNASSVDLSIYGDAHLMKNGLSYSAGLAHVENNRNSCGVGSITRTWTAEDENWNIISCSQTLYFEAGNFSELNIHWPEQEYRLLGCDADIEPEDLPLEYRKPTYDYQPCSNIAMNHKDQVFIVGSDCRKVVRTWTVIDWCKYQPNNNSQGIWTYVQVLKISNSEPPNLSCNKEVLVNPTDCTQTYVQMPNVIASNTSCTGEYTITNNSMFADTTSQDASGIYPIGKHIVTYTIEYACGDELKCVTEVIVDDNIRPVPYCLATLNVALMPVDTDNNGSIDDGMVEVWAKDVNVGSYHPCHNQALDFSFSKDVTDMFKVFNCENVGTNQVEMWVTDHQGRQSYCIVNINVQNNGAQIPDCAPLVGTRPATNGKVTDISGTAIPNVLITHQDHNALGNVVYASYMRTDGTGYFTNDELMVNRDFKVTAWKEGDINKMTNSDVQILEAFIKGEKTFTNPYTYIAADLNEDGRVDVDDFHLMRNLLGAEEEKWPNQRQYVFYSKTDMMSSSPNPLEDEMYQKIDLMNFDVGKGKNLDFIGILKGDLDYYESFLQGVPFLNK